ncbi:MAG: DNA mismatch repair endonuclease MutL [Lactobacillus sp.]|jgi:DNA mismatch repair protein MutL|nr:DNA mismatch repair endonuclease MutL [Lactobacillus sp.]
MEKIHELSANLTNQIAAGEVIERPASVVKELCENSLDAGASEIRISFTDGGLGQIVVQDDGIGIPADQLELAFTRHATSKIATERDLFHIQTLGFRGEALASIAAVSHVKIVTNTGKTGVSAEFTAGEHSQILPAASPVGTKITVTDLFYNTPARLKYLKSRRTEIVKIVDVVNRLALGYPKIAFILTNGQRTLLKTAGNGNLRQTCAQIYGVKLAERMLPLRGTSPDFAISGLISDLTDTRSSRSYITFLLNGRYVHNYQLTQALLAGFGNELSARRYPIAVVNIKLDPLLVDVNVHPTKREVRLSKENQLAKLLTDAVAEVLADRKGPQTDFLATDNSSQQADQLAFALNKNLVDAARPVSLDDRVDQPSAIAESPASIDLNQPRSDQHYLTTASWQQNVLTQQQLTPFGSETAAVSKLPDLTYLGKLNSYLIASNQNDLYLLDLTALQHRLAYDGLWQQLQPGQKSQQGLLTPWTITLSNTDAELLAQNLDPLQEIGLFLENFGQNAFILQSIPLWLHDNDEQRLQKIIDLYLHAAGRDLTTLKKMLASRAARTKETRTADLHSADYQQLLADLQGASDPYYDADGHPIIVRISGHRLGQMFKKE